MEPKEYFIIHSGKDGISIDGPLSAEEAQKRITPDDNGACYYGTVEAFLGYVPEIAHGHYVAGNGRLLIIKGKIVTPCGDLKSVVTAYELP